MNTKRPLPVLIVGIIGWLFAPLLLYILWWKADSLIQGTSQYETWFVLADAALMIGYLAAIAGFWWMRRWSIDLYIACTLIMAGLHLVVDIFTVRHFALPFFVCAVGLWFRPKLGAANG